MAEKEPDFSHISRLQEEQRRVYVDCQDRLATWEKFKSDYDVLENKLASLPDKRSHDVMVPFGSLAFMPGKLVHTNEITVLLGDNWFVERSAKQALEIVGRRKQQVEKNIDGIKADIEGFESRLGFTSHFEQETKNVGYFEIKEELSKEEEDKLKSRRRVAHPKAKSVGAKKVTGSRQSGAKLRSISSKSKGLQSTDDNLFARLDELATKEEQNKELENLELDRLDEIPESVSKHKQDEIQLKMNEKDQHSPLSDTNRQSIRWADTEPVRGVHCSSGSDEDDSEDDSEEDAANNQKLIQVTFTKQGNIKKESEVKLPKEICSPADIYRNFVSTSEPRSILKTSSGNTAETTSGSAAQINTAETTSGSAAQIETADTSKQPLRSEKKQFEREKAFSGEIVERTVMASKSTQSQPEEAKSGERKKVSKFKAGRRNIK